MVMIYTEVNMKRKVKFCSDFKQVNVSTILGWTFSLLNVLLDI